MKGLQNEAIFTNTLITLSVEEQISQNSQITWFRKSLSPSNINSWIVGKSHSYMCSPLDTGFYIEASIQGQNKPTQLKLYGPVLLQKELATIHKKKTIFNVKTILNKNVNYASTLTIIDSKKEIQLTIEGKKLTLSREFLSDQCWNKISCPPFDQKCIIISIKAIKKQLMLFLKEMKIFLHVGDALKIIFQDCLEKNHFLFLISAQPNRKKSKTVTEEQLKHQGQKNCKAYTQEQQIQIIEYPQIKTNSNNQLLFSAKQNEIMKQIFKEQANQKRKKKNYKYNFSIKSPKVPNFQQTHQTQKQRDKNTLQTDRIQSGSSSKHKQIDKINLVEDSTHKMINFLIDENQRLRRQNEALHKNKRQLESKLEQKSNNYNQEVKRMLNLIYSHITKSNDSLQKSRARLQSRASPIKNQYQQNDISKKNVPVFLRKYQNNKADLNEIQHYKFNSTQVIHEQKKHFKQESKNRTGVSPSSNKNPERTFSPKPIFHHTGKKYSYNS